MLTTKETQTLHLIRSELNTVGTFPTVRKLMQLLGYKSPRSASQILISLEEKGYLEKKPNGRYVLSDDVSRQTEREQTVKIPFVGNVACGLPILAIENIEAQIPVSKKLLKSGERYFILRASGTSMNKARINHGDMVLIRQQQTANDKDIVVALIDDEATIKEFHRQDDLVILKPNSNDKSHQPIILTEDFRIQGVVERVINF